MTAASDIEKAFCGSSPRPQTPVLKKARDRVEWTRLDSGVSRGASKLGPPRDGSWEMGDGRWKLGDGRWKLGDGAELEPSVGGLEAPIESFG